MSLEPITKREWLIIVALFVAFAILRLGVLGFPF